MRKLKASKNEGSIYVHSGVDREAHDFPSLLECCAYFAESEAVSMEILPKLHPKSEAYKAVYADLLGSAYEGKSPDFRKVTNDGYVYNEHEGYRPESKQDNRLSNMLNRSLKQASRVVIDDEGSTLRHVQKVIFQRLKAGQRIDEVWIKTADGILV